MSEKRKYQICLLGDVTEAVMGQAPPSRECNKEHNGEPFVKAGEFGVKRPIIREWTTKPLRMARRTDVLLCVVGATCGKINLGEDSAIGRSVAAIRPNPEKLDQFYLYYFLSTLVLRLRSGSQGAAQTVISKQMIREIHIPLPPLSEQRRLVGLLDAAFAGLATATAHTQKNLTHARELFGTHLNAIFERVGREWKQGRLGDHFDIKTGGTPLVSEKSFWNGGIPWYSSGELGPILTGNPKRNISPLGLAKSNTKLLPKGTLLVGIYDTAALKMSLLDREAATNQAVAGVKPTAEMNLGYVRWAIESIKPEVLALRRGVRQKNLSLKKIKDIEIPLSSEQNQRAVLCEIEAVLSHSERLVLIAERKLAALEELKQSLLHRAFRGELSGKSAKIVLTS